MKPKTEIYCVSFYREGPDGKPVKRFYRLGGDMLSDIDMKPIKVSEIKLGFGVVTVSFSDETSHSFGYDPKTMDVFRRVIKLIEDEPRNVD
jgi:hypothetical protein